MEGEAEQLKDSLMTSEDSFTSNALFVACVPLVIDIQISNMLEIDMVTAIQS